MPLEETQARQAFHPEEAGIMLDRLAIELLHALAKNPSAVPELQHEAHELLACVRAWLATQAAGTDIPQQADCSYVPGHETDANADLSSVVRGLRELAEHLLFLAELDEARGSEWG